MKLIKEKKFYKTLFAIMIPIALQNVLSVTVSLVDSLMVGTLGEVAIAAVSVAGQPFFLFNIITFGLASGAGVLISQYWGKGEIKAIKSILALVLQIALVLGVIFCILNLVMPDKLAALYLKKSDANAPQVISEAVSYMQVMSVAYILHGLTNTTFMVIRNVEKVKIALFSNIVAICVNVFLNYCLIFGKLGCPALGVKGAAIATVIAKGVEFSIMFIYMTFIDKVLKFKIYKDIFTFDKRLFKDYIKFSSPVVVNEATWALGATVLALILGKISSSVIAAYSIVQIVYQMSSVFLFGVGAAAAVIIGKAIGEKADKNRIKDISFTFQIVSLVVGLVCFSLILMLKQPILSLYSIPPETYKIASDMMIVFAILSIFVAFSVTNMLGILRGGGDTKAVMIMDVLFLYAVSIPLGALCGLVFKLPIFITFMALKSDEIIKCFISIIRVFKNNWIKDVTSKSDKIKQEEEKELNSVEDNSNSKN